ncbi:hypothetical protein GCM10010495_64750 [Kitasatospora herbaricolor]|uniref:Uncharacterized protein n=1 Tax=Kitasatospora herbaricolor TaxID=68217 RepID=A0ABZ1W222_9ACTN|nr:hypothetical protein [Kitasatospora herbaricolor]MDQ0312655.1 hypothetical protein [Kitasatospora herbaricolor]GGV38506.1 hypothetical protein GCM10010495_64750 [Kitasatospora herbaricolor]
MTDNQGPKSLSDDAEMFAIALLKARLAAGSRPAAAKACSDILDRFEARSDEGGLRTLAAHLVEVAAGLAGGRLDALERLEQIERDALQRQQQPGQWPGP